MDRYLAARGSGTGPPGPRNQEETGFQQPAPHTPQVNTPARGVINVGRNTPPGARPAGTHSVVPPRVTCFSCGRRGHYANSCQYPPLSPDEQEQLRESAHAHRLQQAGLMSSSSPHVNHISSQIAGRNIFTPQGPEERDGTQREVGNRTDTAGDRISEIHEHEGQSAPGGNAPTMNEPVASRRGTSMANRPTTVGAACAVLSRLPPVLSRLQKIMAEKRARMEAEDTQDTEAARPMKTRRRAHMESRGEETSAQDTDNQARQEPGEEETIEVSLGEISGGSRNPSRIPPINLMKDQEPYSIEKALTSIKPDITFPQLLDVSPRLRREQALLLRSSQPRIRRKKGGEENTQVLTAGGPLHMTKAEEDSEVDCLYITAWCGKTEIPNVLVDGGAMIELISEELVTSLHLDKHPVKDLGIRLADDSLVRLKHYVWVDLNVEGIVARIRAYIMPVKETYQILLSRRWLKRMKGVEDHRNNTLIIQGVDGILRKAKGRPAPPADFELIPSGDQPNKDTSYHDMDIDAEDAIDDLLQELDKMDATDKESGKGGHR